MPHFMTETWFALGGIAVLVVWSLYGLTGIIDGCFAAHREYRSFQRHQRKMMQQNINELIIANSTSGVQLLKDALTDCLVQYRQLP